MPLCLILANAAGTGWLNLTNGALGAAVLLCVGLIAGSAAYEFAARARQRAHIIRHADAAVRELLHGGGRG